MQTETPKQLTPHIAADRWCCIIIRSNGELEVLHETHDTETAARDYAVRCCSWYQLVRVAVAPVTVHAERLAIVHDPLKGKAPELERATK